jgi:hypothetical protein
VKDPFPQVPEEVGEIARGDRSIRLSWTCREFTSAPSRSLIGLSLFLEPDRDRSRCVSEAQAAVFSGKQPAGDPQPAPLLEISHRGLSPRAGGVSAPFILAAVHAVILATPVSFSWTISPLLMPDTVPRRLRPPKRDALPNYSLLTDRARSLL